MKTCHVARLHSPPQNGTKKGTLLGWGIEKSLNAALNYAKKDIRVLFGANANSKFHQSQSLVAKLKITTFWNLASPNLEPPSSQVPSVFWNLFWNLFKSQNHSNGIHPCRNEFPVGFSRNSDLQRVIAFVNKIQHNQKFTLLT